MMGSKLGALLLAALLASTAAKAATLSAWIEMTGAAQSLRAIATEACPVAEADGKTLPLGQRSAADQAFPVLSCQATLPKGVGKVSLDGLTLKTLPDKIDRILVLGDTGCRLKGKFVQDCNDPAAWPFAAIAAQAATEKPDLIIHVGDYFYRETPCPAERSGCAGSPYGDAWPAWDADFFTPGRKLLGAAPWIMVRGNHEQCGRGAFGWFRFLDAGETPLSCPAEAAPFVVSVGDQHLFVLDSADTEDGSAPPDKVALFLGELQAIQPMDESGSGWILTHRPFWGFTPETSGEIGESDEMPTNRTEQEAAKGDALSGVQMILSGHVHMFSAADFDGARPAQLIVGNGGDVRDGGLPGILARKVQIAGLPAATEVVEQFGYLVLDRSAEGWDGALKQADGSVMARCTIRGRGLKCGKP